MQILQDAKSASAVQSNSEPTQPFRQKTPSIHPDREVMRLVFPDGSVRTVNPDVKDT